MEYSVHHLSKEELFILLDAFSDNFLAVPLIKTPKYFAPKAKGFRLNKIPRKLMYKIYFDEIRSTQNTSLEKYLVSYMTECFDDAGISDLIKNFDGTVFELSSQLEFLILKSKIKVSPHTILLMCKYECTSEEINIIKAYHECIVTITAHQQAVYEEKYAELKKQTEDQLRTQEMRASEMYKNLELSTAEKYKKLEEEYLICQNNLRDCVAESERANAETVRLNNLIIEARRIIDTLRHQLQDYHDIRKKVVEQRDEIASLNERIKHLNDVIQELQAKVLTPDDTLDICREIVDDLKTTRLDESELKNIVHNTFDRNMSIVDAWIKLGEIDNSKIESIFTAMKENHINDSKIEELDAIENDVCIRYIIIKSLKVLFFRFLEQKAQKSKIEKQFQSEE